MDRYDHAAELIFNSSVTIALTGAGISVDSGIPPFRGNNGTWDTFDPDAFGEFKSFLSNPGRSWSFFYSMYQTIRHASPNAAHRYLSQMESMGLLRHVFTQNIDNLHQLSGTKSVIELHGNINSLRCLDCLDRLITENFEFVESDFPPRCICGGVLKPEIVLFGEPLPADAYFSAVQALQNCEVLLLIGTSGFVAPASSLPEIAHKNNAVLIEINIERTYFTDLYNPLFIQGQAGKVLGNVVDRLLALNQ